MCFLISKDGRNVPGPIQVHLGPRGSVYRSPGVLERRSEEKVEVFWFLQKLFQINSMSIEFRSANVWLSDHVDLNSMSIATVPHIPCQYVINSTISIESMGHGIRFSQCCGSHNFSTDDHWQGLALSMHSSFDS